MSKVGIFGAGWVGLVTGSCFADLGHDVVIRDVVPEKIDTLRAGRVDAAGAGPDRLRQVQAEFGLGLEDPLDRGAQRAGHVHPGPFVVVGERP